MTSQQIMRIRRFNRAVARRIGALDSSYLQRGRPLGEARLIFEVGTRGTDARTLRRKLDLDSGYLSRLLRSLERQGVIDVERLTEDGRLRRINLTAFGRDEFANMSGFRTSSQNRC